MISIPDMVPNLRSQIGSPKFPAAAEALSEGYGAVTGHGEWFMIQFDRQQILERQLVWLSGKMWERDHLVKGLTVWCLVISGLARSVEYCHVMSEMSQSHPVTLTCNVTSSLAATLPWCHSVQEEIFSKASSFSFWEHLRLDWTIWSLQTWPGKLHWAFKNSKKKKPPKEKIKKRLRGCLLQKVWDAMFSVPQVLVGYTATLRWKLNEWFPNGSAILLFHGSIMVHCQGCSTNPTFVFPKGWGYGKGRRYFCSCVHGKPGWGTALLSFP